MYTEEDLVRIDQAIHKLQIGERVVSVSYGDHSVRYADIQLNDLLSMRQRMRAECKVPGTYSKRRILFSTHKGME